MLAKRKGTIRNRKVKSRGKGWNESILKESKFLLNRNIKKKQSELLMKGRHFMDNNFIMNRERGML